MYQIIVVQHPKRKVEQSLLYVHNGVVLNRYRLLNETIITYKKIIFPIKIS